MSNKDAGKPHGERVLIVEDDEAARVGLQQLVTKWGFIVETAGDGAEALVKLAAFDPGIVLTDLVMPHMDGLALLRALHEQHAEVTTVVLTAQGKVETAVEAIQQGAYDYLTKPVDLQRLRILLDKIVERRDTLREVKALRHQLRAQGAFGSMIGSSPEMRQIYRMIEQAAPTNASVLVVGESGTGKELVAQTIHQLSPRGRRPFVPVNCAAIPEDAARERALRPREGRLHRRDRSARRALRAGRRRHALPRRNRRDDAQRRRSSCCASCRSARSAGSAGSNEQSVDVRVIAATNRDLAADDRRAASSARTCTTG